MEIIALTKKNKRVILQKTASAIRRGAAVVFPTETSYGLLCDATRAESVRNIFSLKGRSQKNPLPLLVSSRTMARRYLQWEKTHDRLAQQYWPGALTIVAPLKRSSTWGALVSAGTGTVGVRVSSHLLVMALMRRVGRPLVATSANKSGGGNCYRIAAVLRQLQKKRHHIALVIDAGTLPRRRPSTIVAAQHGHLCVIRQGAVRLEQENNETKKQ